MQDMQDMQDDNLPFTTPALMPVALIYIHFSRLKL